MASITCRIVNPTFAGIQGIYASLNCKDHHGNIMARYESFSNDDGNIQYWFRVVLGDETHEPEPEIIDVLQFPGVSMTFLPGIREPSFPWRNIHTELQLVGTGQHEFILVLNEHSASYQLHHAITSLHEAQMEWERTFKDHEMDGIDAQPSRSPSPLRLPSPIITRQAGLVSQAELMSAGSTSQAGLAPQAELMSAGSTSRTGLARAGTAPPQDVLAPQATRGVKRKLSCEGNETIFDSNCNRSAKRRGVTRRNKRTKRMMTPDSDDCL
ncbi:restless-like transposase [Fusarium austroafricanum]|uniref:Restless-like transposase n=1 Tax=Fusarium austroafricanum TaxID=2364996 RepID=A0A8H4KEB4_9HYPO|nr:restless-like transposase [Fusarium austroafricanum]